MKFLFSCLIYINYNLPIMNKLTDDNANILIFIWNWRPIYISMFWKNIHIRHVFRTFTNRGAGFFCVKKLCMRTWVFVTLLRYCSDVKPFPRVTHSIQGTQMRKNSKLEHQQYLLLKGKNCDWSWTVLELQKLQLQRNIFIRIIFLFFSR